MIIDPEDPRASKAVDAIKSGNVDVLKTLLSEYPELVTAHVGSETEARTLLHVLTDWPGFLDNNINTAKILIDAGANVNAKFIGHHSETPLHWAASNDDVQMLDALLDAGADIEAGGGVIAETPLADARAFLQLKCAHRLVERGASVGLSDATTLGLLDKVQEFYSTHPLPSNTDTNHAFWNACHGSQLATAQYLLDHGADINALPPWEPMTPLDAAKRSKADDLVVWLKEIGGKEKDQLENR